MTREENLENLLRLALPYVRVGEAIEEMMHPDGKTLEQEIKEALGIDAEGNDPADGPTDHSPAGG